jgi:hypothetical protein
VKQRMQASPNLGQALQQLVLIKVSFENSPIF